MRNSLSESRMAWLATGLVAGLAVAYFWPHEPAYATTADRDSNFAMVTIPVGTSAAGISDPMDGMFILDFHTGQLMGAVLNRQNGKFANLYRRDLAKDFSVDPQATPHYAIVTGYAQLASQANLTFASGVVYVGELSSGKVIAYAFPWQEARKPQPAQHLLVPIDFIQWRQPTQKDK